MKRFVYGLIDPDTREMRYVGATVVGMRRPRQHLRPSAYDGKSKHTHNNRWIKSVIDSGRVPEIVIIEHCDDPYLTEIGWVEYFRSIGCHLTNSTDGGQGRGGYKASEETKKKLSSRVHTSQWRERMSTAQKKRYSAQEVSEETRRRLSEAGKRANQDPEVKKRLSAAQKARRKRERDTNSK